MERMVNMSLRDFCQAVSSDSFAPGGGCVSALAGALGASLATMVFRLTIGKKKYLEFDAENKALLSDVEGHAKALLECIDRDAEGCQWILEAMALPKENEVDRLRRKQALSDASKKANEAPLAVVDHALALLRLFKHAINKVNRNAITDWAVGAMNAYTALEGAAMNAKINCGSVDDVRYCKDLETRFRTVLGEGRAIMEEIRNQVHSSLDSSH